MKRNELLHAVLVGLNHFLDHLSADGACLSGAEVAVVALLEVDAYLPWRSITSKTKRFLTVNHPD